MKPDLTNMLLNRTGTRSPTDNQMLYFFMTCLKHEFSRRDMPRIHYGLLRGGRVTGNLEPETRSGLELHKIFLGQAWQLTRVRRIAALPPK